MKTAQQPEGSAISALGGTIPTRLGENSPMGNPRPWAPRRSSLGKTCAGAASSHPSCGAPRFTHIAQDGALRRNDTPTGGRACVRAHTHMCCEMSGDWGGRPPVHQPRDELDGRRRIRVSESWVTEDEVPRHQQLHAGRVGRTGHGPDSGRRLLARVPVCINGFRSAWTFQPLMSE